MRLTINPVQIYTQKLAVLYLGHGELPPYQQLAEYLAVPLYIATFSDYMSTGTETFFLTWRDGCLTLLDQKQFKKGGLTVAIEPRNGEQRSFPSPKQGALAQAVGRKTKTVVDATTGWGQDSLYLFRMGYTVLCIERSPIMLALLTDAFTRLTQKEWVQKLAIPVPHLLAGNAIELLATLPTPPDCIYLDPMFPAKRKKSALAKKAMTTLRDLLGDDDDKEQLLSVALQATGKRVVVKSPDYAPPLGAKPNESFSGKLVRYDVYLKS